MQVTQKITIRAQLCAAALTPLITEMCSSRVHKKTEDVREAGLTGSRCWVCGEASCAPSVSACWGRRRCSPPWSTAAPYLSGHRSHHIHEHQALHTSFRKLNVIRGVLVSQRAEYGRFKPSSAWVFQVLDHLLHSFAFETVFVFHVHLVKPQLLFVSITRLHKRDPNTTNVDKTQ